MDLHTPHNLTLPLASTSTESRGSTTPAYQPSMYCGSRRAWVPAGRLVSGLEAVQVTVQAPSSAVTSLPVALEEATGRYRTALRCSEVHPH